jgi:hypothetical protein
VVSAMPILPALAFQRLRSFIMRSQVAVFCGPSFMAAVNYVNSSYWLCEFTHQI